MLVSVLNGKKKKRLQRKEKSTSEPQKKMKVKQSWPHYNQTRLKQGRKVERIWALDLDLSFCLNLD